MTDVVKFAKERVAVLEAETARLKDYIRMTERLLKDGWLGASGMADRAESGNGAAAPAASPAGKNGAAGAPKAALDADTSDEGMAAAIAKQIGSEAERKNLFRRSGA